MKALFAFTRSTSIRCISSKDFFVPCRCSFHSFRSFTRYTYDNVSICFASLQSNANTCDFVCTEFIIILLNVCIYLKWARTLVVGFLLMILFIFFSFHSIVSLLLLFSLSLPSSIALSHTHCCDIDCNRKDRR